MNNFSKGKESFRKSRLFRAICGALVLIAFVIGLGGGILAAFLGIVWFISLCPLVFGPLAVFCGLVALCYKEDMLG